MMNQAGRSSCDGTFPVSLICALIVSPAPAVTSTLCRYPLVVLQQTSQSCSTPHCSFVPSCFRPRRKQDPVVFALAIALLVVMYEILLQCSPQRRFSKQDQPRQTFFFDRSHPAFRTRVQIRAPCWQSKRIHAFRPDQSSPQICHGTYDPIVASARIFPRHLHHKAFLFPHLVLGALRFDGISTHQICSPRASDTNPESYQAWPLPPRPPVPFEAGGDRSRPASPFLLRKGVADP